MTQEHPITPPPELVQQWINEEDGLTAGHIATQAAQWGADQELEACCELLIDKCFVGQATLLREWRRPKPPSLKEQALNTLDGMSGCMRAGFIPKRSDLDTIRRALEQLPN